MLQFETTNGPFFCDRDFICDGSPVIAALSNDELDKPIACPFTKRQMEHMVTLIGYQRCDYQFNDLLWNNDIRGTAHLIYHYQLAWLPGMMERLYSKMIENNRSSMATFVVCRELMTPQKLKTLAIHWVGNWGWKCDPYYKEIFALGENGWANIMVGITTNRQRDLLMRYVKNIREWSDGLYNAFTSLAVRVEMVRELDDHLPEMFDAHKIMAEWIEKTNIPLTQNLLDHLYCKILRSTSFYSAETILINAAQNGTLPPCKISSGFAIELFQDAGGFSSDRWCDLAALPIS